MSKGNSKDFNSIIGEGFKEWHINNYKNYSPEHILTNRYYDGNYLVDYRRPIEHYLKACGCKILRTNNNWWDDRFYVYHTPPVKAVDPVVWFDEVYKDGVYWSNNKKALVAIILSTILFITLGSLMKIYF